MIPPNSYSKNSWQSRIKSCACKYFCCNAHASKTCAANNANEFIRTIGKCVSWFPNSIIKKNNKNKKTKTGYWKTIKNPANQ